MNHETNSDDFPITCEIESFFQSNCANIFWDNSQTSNDKDFFLKQIDTTIKRETNEDTLPDLNENMTNILSNFPITDSFFSDERLFCKPKNDITKSEQIKSMIQRKCEQTQENKGGNVGESSFISKTKKQNKKTEKKIKRTENKKKKTEKKNKQTEKAKQKIPKKAKKNLDPELLALRPKRKRAQLCTLDIEMTEYEKKQLRQLSKEELANLSNEDRLVRKRIRDRVSARNSRQRQKEYLKKLELRAQEILDEKNKVVERFSELETENLKLKEEIKKLKDLVLSAITNSDFITPQRNTNNLSGALNKPKKRRKIQKKQTQSLQINYY
ncbi:basic-leucine zipper transcription factor f-related [Anaeramoeba flamelloides]|uniref:Basic-leucine zipper transcription factor f-related n=1 Tax=Anaeramoeba flamelloides TaxID=1746091 RepID=A0AAV8AGR0_9EUKA|nr:basic-leucine zipper transcription factor f-related [Anaeramoeba flamelloides]